MGIVADRQPHNYRKINHRLGQFLGLLIIASCSTLFFILSGHELLKHAGFLDWERIDASITSTYLSRKEPKNSDRVLNELCCAYQFEVEGVSYKGSGCGLPIPSIYNDENNREWAIKNFEKESNGRIEILYNTKDPSESVILTQKWIIANGIVILISSGLLFLLFKFMFGYFRRKYSVKGSAPLSTTNTVGS